MYNLRVMPKNAIQLEAKSTTRLPEELPDQHLDRHYIISRTPNISG